jgi:D-arabinose 1-dehydrogenase-like Zn-dependent alcohol dehydrogenase
MQNCCPRTGADKEPLASKLGVHYYIDSAAVDTAAELQKLGGARVILTTAPNANAISSVIGGLGLNGNLLIPAAPNEPLTTGVLPLINGPPADLGLVFRNRPRLSEYFGIQRAKRRASDDREIPSQSRG